MTRRELARRLRQGDAITDPERGGLESQHRTTHLIAPVWNYSIKKDFTKKWNYAII